MKYTVDRVDFSGGSCMKILKTCTGDDESFAVPEGVTDMWRFGACPNLKSVTIPASVRWIPRDAFRLCPRLRELNVADHPNYAAADGVLYNRDKTKVMGWYSAEKLADLTFSEGVRTIDTGAFENCPHIKRVVFPASLESIYKDAFKGCVNLTEVRLPVRGSFGYIRMIGEEAFRGCTSLKTVETGDDASLGLCDGAFRECTSLEAFTLPEWIQRIPDNLFRDCTALREIELPHDANHIGEHAFENCRSLERIAFSEQLYRIGEGAFAGCRALCELDLPENVSCIEKHAFMNSGVTHIGIPDKVREIGEKTFFGCKELKAVRLGRETETIGDQAFAGCESLEEITLPDTVKHLGRDVFDGCISLRSVIHMGVTYEIGDGKYEAYQALGEIESRIQKRFFPPKKKGYLRITAPYMDEFEYLSRDDDDESERTAEIVIEVDDNGE